MQRNRRTVLLLALLCISPCAVGQQTQQEVPVAATVKKTVTAIGYPAGKTINVDLRGTGLMASRCGRCQSEGGTRCPQGQRRCSTSRCRTHPQSCGSSSCPTPGAIQSRPGDSRHASRIGRQYGRCALCHRQIRFASRSSDRTCQAIRNYPFSPRSESCRGRLHR
jgi:hypothetical protein